MAPAVALALKLGSVVPAIVKLVTGSDEKEAVAERVVSAAEALTGVSRDDEEKLKKAIIQNSATVLELEKLAASLEIERLKADVEIIKAVNTTMQAESKSEHWMQWSWRPVTGYSFAAYVSSLWLLPLVNKVPVTMSFELVTAIGAILGVSAWYRGRQKVGETKFLPDITISRSSK